MMLDGRGVGLDDICISDGCPDLLAAVGSREVYFPATSCRPSGVSVPPCSNTSVSVSIPNWHEVTMISLSPLAIAAPVWFERAPVRAR